MERHGVRAELRGQREMMCLWLMKTEHQALWPPAWGSGLDPEAWGGWMGLARPAGWPGGHGCCGQASTEPHKAPLLGRAQLPWARAGGRHRRCRNAPSQERGVGGHLCQVPSPQHPVLPAGPETPMACTPWAPCLRSSRPFAGSCLGSLHLTCPGRCRRNGHAAPSSSGMCQAARPPGLSPPLGQTC